MKLTTVDSAIDYAKTIQYSTDVMLDDKGEYHVVDHSALQHYKKHFKHIAEVKQTPVVTFMQMENATIEVDGVKWLVVTATSIQDALRAVEWARVLGSVGATHIETNNGVLVLRAEVTRNGVEQ